MCENTVETKKICIRILLDDIHMHKDYENLLILLHIPVPDKAAMDENIRYA